MRAVTTIVVLVFAGVILGDLLAHPGPTNSLINGFTNLWTTAVKGSAGAYSTSG